jgi:hypothetical protein
MAQLRAYRDNGVILFDTNLISYGLIKSGYLQYSQSWTRRELKSAQLDPNNGANYTEVQVLFDSTYTDGLWAFTVTNAISPIVFITGSGTLNGTAISGSSITFYYSNASNSTKYYCFDLMGNNIAGSPYLKTYDTTGRITFNSLQPPINIIGAVQAPSPGPLDQYGRYTTCYTSGYNVKQAELGPASPYRRPRANSIVDIAGAPGVEYAVNLPFSRSCGIHDLFDFTGFQSSTQYSMVEGAYGRTGGISFMFGASAGTSYAQLNTSGQTQPCSFVNIPTDRYPTALLINTANYPFPFN